MLDGAIKFAGMVENAGLVLIEDTRTGTPPEPVAQRTTLGTHAVFHQQETGKEIDVVKSAGRSADAFRGCSGFLQFGAHLADSLRKAGIGRESFEKSFRYLYRLPTEFCA